MESNKEAPPGCRSRWDGPMGQALMQADLAAQRGEIPVGAILFDKDGNPIGKGYNQSIALNDPTAHAEILAIREGCRKSSNYRIPGSTLVVTLEPCIMCLGAIIHARIDTVVYGADDPKTGAIASRLHGNDLPWANHCFTVIPGIMAPECSSLIKSFFKKRRQERKATK
ncbi:tRNA adenosine(34) deaminase TadA [Desulfoplanes sp.]